jgi:hypothetical protein
VRMGTPSRSRRRAQASDNEPTVVRDPLANIAAVYAARERPMGERLALALSWNRLASQLRSGLTEVLRRSTTRQ